MEVLGDIGSTSEDRSEREDSVMIRHYPMGDPLVDVSNVAAVGYPVANQRDATSSIVIHRSIDGRWSIIDDGDLDHVPEHLRERARSMAVAVVSGVNATGPTVTRVVVGDQVAFAGLWSASHQDGPCCCVITSDERSQECSMASRS
jgi:hypothetical protein